MIRKVKSVIQEQQFNPGVLGIFINPHYFMRKCLLDEIKQKSSEIKGSVLDIGCGIKPYKNIFTKHRQYIGLEFDSAEQRLESTAEVFYDGKKFPFPNNRFDSAICTEVLEHIFNPDEFLQEVYRVLKNNGMLMITVPFVWYEHSQPYDYGRYSSFGLKHILTSHGFKILHHKKLGTSVSTISQLICGYIYKKLYPIKNYKIKLVLFIIFISPWTILGLLLSKVFKDNEDLYLNNLIIAKKHE